MILHHFQSKLAILLLALLCLPACNAEPTGAIDVFVTGEVILEKVERLGVNLGPTTYYQDQQYAVNPLAHGGFERGQQRMVIRVAEGTENTVRDEYIEIEDPDRHIVATFAGGSYTIATGPRRGETGTILEHDTDTGTFTLEKHAEPIAEGEYLWLHGPWIDRATPDPDDPRIERGIGIGDFRWVSDEEVELGYTARDDSGQALVFRFPAEAGRLTGGIRHYFRATPRNTYTVTLEARATAPGAEIGVTMENHGLAPESPFHRLQLLPKTTRALSQEWQQYVFSAQTGPDDEIGQNFSGIVITATAAGGEAQEVHIDNVAMSNDRAEHPSGFNRNVVETLKEAQPGTLRFYDVFDLGAPLDGYTAAAATDASWSFMGLRSRARIGNVTATLGQCLELANEVGANPWITVPASNTPDEWRQLISFLAAPGDFDDAAARRAQQGRNAPWTSEFETVYLEIGNEWWNAIFRPYYVWAPEKFAELCTLIAETARAHPHFDAARIKIVAGGWAINAHHWNGIVAAQARGIDIVSIAPYLVHELERAESGADRWGALFAGVESYMAEGGQSTLADLQALENPPGLAVYELNTHITGGEAPADRVSTITASVAAGVGVLDQAMSVMQEMRAAPINYFVLLQRAFNERLGLWGVLIREPDGRLRPRPVWHGLRLANQHFLSGKLVSTLVENSPDWRQESNGSVVEIDSVPALHAYACIEQGSDGKRVARVLLINRNWEEPMPVRLHLPFHVDADAKMYVLAGDTPAANNEEMESVKVREQQLRFIENGRITLTPASATVCVLTEK